MDDYGVQDSSNMTDTYTSNSYSYNDSRGGYENDKSNDFSFSKQENDTSPARYQAHVEVDTYRLSNADDFTGRSNAHENDRGNDFSFPKENDSPSIMNEAHTPGGQVHEHQSSDNDNLIDDIKQSSNSDSEDLPSKNGLENCRSEGLENAEDLDSKNINFKVDQYSQNTNQDTRSDRFMNVNEYDNDDCCSCKSNPLMCLAFFCDCFG